MGRRNLVKYAEQGMQRIGKHQGYDMMGSEICELFNMALKDHDSLFKSLDISYYMGIEAGVRLAKAIRKERG